MTAKKRAKLHTAYQKQMRNNVQDILRPTPLAPYLMYGILFWQPFGTIVQDVFVCVCVCRHLGQFDKTLN